MSGKNSTGGVDFGNTLSQLQSGKGVDLAGIAGQLTDSKSRGLGDIIRGFSIYLKQKDPFEIHQKGLFYCGSIKLCNQLFILKSLWLFT